MMQSQVRANAHNEDLYRGNYVKSGMAYYQGDMGAAEDRIARAMHKKIPSREEQARVEWLRDNSFHVTAVLLALRSGKEKTADEIIEFAKRRGDEFTHRSLSNVVSYLNGTGMVKIRIRRFSGSLATFKSYELISRAML